MFLIKKFSSQKFLLPVKPSCPPAENDNETPDDAPEKSCLTGNLDPCKGLERAIPISVIPYLSSNVCPKRNKKMSEKRIAMNSHE